MRRWIRVLRPVSVVAAVAAAISGVVVASAATGYSNTLLTADKAGIAANTDANLVNPWGIAFSPTGPFWISDNNGNVSTLYDGTGAALPLVVTIPLPGGGPGGAPTGIVFNPGNATDFKVSKGNKSAGALFIFATEDGTISGWSPTVDATHAIIKVDRSTTPSAKNGAVYKGLAYATPGGKGHIYAANFRSGKVDVFDSTWTKVTLAGKFKDPSVPAALSPFGIQALDGKIYVSYALPNAARHDDEAGVGVGAVSVFNTDGTLSSSLISGGKLNSPWGMAMAPAAFGDFSNDLLVANFGDGRINAFNPATGAFIGTLSDSAGTPIVTGGLWGISFGNGVKAGSTTTLYYTAGTNGEKDGLFGAIAPLAAVVVPKLPPAGVGFQLPGQIPPPLLVLIAAGVIAILAAGSLALMRED